MAVISITCMPKTKRIQLLWATKEPVSLKKSTIQLVNTKSPITLSSQRITAKSVKHVNQTKSCICEHCFDYWLCNQFDRETHLTTKEGKQVKSFSCHTTFADHALVRTSTLVRVNANVDLRHVCFLWCCPITRAGGVMNFFNAKENQTTCSCALCVVVINFAVY